MAIKTVPIRSIEEKVENMYEDCRAKCSHLTKKEKTF